MFSRYLKDKGSSNVSTPFFLAVGFHKPHVPFKFPEEYLNLFPIEGVKPPSNPKK